ncbi:hypothetical protein [Bradyrhizobium diazoefficiens]|uniref:Uncharacterized protein n=1 Tax=Bradyrhizobium diazoefficiens TaxID=1355477 RepID=A0A809Z7A5_9BRAD|nr:hypothetical protein XF1B_47500 [Bradyrhizobium diazoefficiens]BCE48334.1 hypothetical protein XF4B_46830 [Bradyrhizobium diazoefficiens]BCE91850.1 hypothetical protein XF10B_46480 [Bradyrhizobium diazoefficiens]BCF26778.1 hypothetical protein XF14B_47300 [Bradyrhizobium diazoefficiens]
MSETESRPSHAAMHMAVRNILFNELGLSRDGIETLVRQEVTGVTAQRFRNTDEVENFVIRAISHVVWGQWNRKKLEKMIEDQVNARVKAHVKEQVDAILNDKLKIEIGA